MLINASPMFLMRFISQFLIRNVFLIANLLCQNQHTRELINDQIRHENTTKT